MSVNTSHRPSSLVDAWPPDTPASLEDCCISFFVENIFHFLDKTDNSYMLKPGITFPQGLSDKILSKIVTSIKFCQKAEDSVFGIFNNRATTCLTELPLRYTAVTCEELDFLCRHPIRKIDITYCHEITSEFVDSINQMSRTLHSLQLGGNDLLEKMEIQIKEEELEDMPTAHGDMRRSQKRPLFNLPILRSLSLRDINTFKPIDGIYRDKVTFLVQVIQPLKNLTHLDICECQLERTVEQIGLLELPNLVSLNLCNSLNGNYTALRNIGNLKTLR